MLPVILNGVKTHALIDSGASCCLLSKSVADLMPRSLFSIKAGGKQIKGVGNGLLQTVGDMSVQVRIAGKDWPMKMAVSSEVEPVGCYLGMDFFMAHDCDFSVAKGTFQIGNSSVKLMPESSVNVCARVRVENDVMVPPHSKVVISGKAEALWKRMKTEVCVVEPSARAKVLAKQGIHVA